MKLLNNDLQRSILLVKSLKTLFILFQFQVTTAVFANILEVTCRLQSFSSTLMFLEVSYKPGLILLIKQQYNNMIVAYDRGKPWDSSIWSLMTHVQNGPWGRHRVNLRCLKMVGEQWSHYIKSLSLQIWQKSNLALQN